MHANYLANGLGGQSMMLVHLACQRRIPATVAITGDTGGEKDRVMMNGKRVTALQFFCDYVVPYCGAHGIEALMVRSIQRDGTPVPTVDEMIERSARVALETDGDFDKMTRGMCVPVFTNDKSKGRLMQSCTEKKKIRAIHQEAKRRGITLLRSAIGFHYGETHRIKARYLHDESGWSIFKPQINRGGRLRDVRWLEHYYPLVDLKLNREAVRKELKKHDVPYLVTTECDLCPHQDYQRWAMHTPELIARAAKIEACWKGKLFFTDKRIPLLESLKIQKQEWAEKGKNVELPGFGCEGGAYCGI